MTVKPYNTGQTKKEEVREMFDNIAPKYDLLNHTLSMNIDRIWRRRVVRIVCRSRPHRILDVATGTGDLAIEMARRIRDVHVLGVDLSEKMLDVARCKVAARGLDERVVLDVGDAEHLRVSDASVDVVTVAFGVRNFGDLEAGLREMARTIKPGGKVVILEFSRPRNRLFRVLYEFYTYKILPRIGGMVSKDKRAYEYLPASVGEFPAPAEFMSMMERAGFRGCGPGARVSGSRRYIPASDEEMVILHIAHGDGAADGFVPPGGREGPAQYPSGSGRKGRTQGDGRRRGRSAREERHGVQTGAGACEGRSLLRREPRDEHHPPRPCRGAAPDDRKFHVAVAREDYRPDGLLRDGEKNPRGRYFAGRRFVCGRGARGAGFGKKFGRDGAVVGIFEYLWAVLAGREKLSGRVMRRLTTFIAVIFAAAAFAPLRAQSLDAFKERLAAPVVSDAAFGTARVTVTEYGDAEKAVDDASRVGQRLRLRGYRVCIFFDNGQDARAGAFAAEALFKETYPGIMVYPVYENPYFKVVVGNCLTAEEAIILKGKIASTFPKAFVKSEEFSMADLLN